jgi:hypothetical protein
MSTATATQNHFPHSIALAAAASVVVVGGLAAWGISESQENVTTAPGQTAQVYTQHQMCPDNRCLPHEQQPPRGGAHNSRSLEESLKGTGKSPAGGGQTQIGLT